MESTLTKLLQSPTGLESLDPFHRAGNRFRKWHDCCYSSLLGSITIKDRPGETVEIEPTSLLA